MLNRKQRQFAHNYVVHLAGPAAARAAGYSPSCASETAGRLLAHPEVAELVQQLHLRATPGKPHPPAAG